MNVTCPRCFAIYTLPDNMLADKPRRMRCSSCQNEWLETMMPKSSIAEFAPPPPPPAPSLEPSSESPPPRRAPEPEPTYIRPKREKQVIELAKPPKPNILVPLAWTSFMLISFLGIAALLHTPLSHLSPNIANFYEDVGLPVDGVNEWFSFEDIKVEKSSEDGATVLAVRGYVVNQSHRNRTLPLLELYWLSKDGKKGPPQIIAANPATIAIGEKAFFSSRLTGIDASLGGEVKVTFAQAAPNAQTHETPPDHSAPTHEAPTSSAHEAPAVHHTAEAEPLAAAPSPPPNPTAEAETVPHTTTEQDSQHDTHQDSNHEQDSAHAPEHAPTSHH